MPQILYAGEAARVLMMPEETLRELIKLDPKLVYGRTLNGEPKFDASVISQHLWAIRHKAINAGLLGARFVGDAMIQWPPDIGEVTTPPDDEPKLTADEQAAYDYARKRITDLRNELSVLEAFAESIERRV